MIRWKKRIWAAALSAALMAGASGYGGGIPIVSEVRETEGYPDAQTMLIIATEANRCRQVYTDQIWQVKVGADDEDFQSYLLEEIRTFLKELKTMNLLADEREISLTSQEREQLGELSGEYYDSLTAEDKAYTGAGEQDVYDMYEAYHRANKLVDELTKDVDLEISDSEAKVIRVQEIRLTDQAKAQELYRRVTEEGADFASVARSMSEDGATEKAVGRSERSKAYEDAVFSLEAGQISQVFEDGGSWYIVRCADDYDEEATLERKNRLALQRKNQAFRQIYDAFAAEHPVEISGDIWGSVSLADSGGSVTTDFFERYAERME
ncbi:MAG: peptidylprolyl isomerase [Eubacteriales bacterium]|nr:peptidylprolyl isomerase [Eubacteriales bacterium]